MAIDESAGRGASGASIDLGAVFIAEVRRQFEGAVAKIRHCVDQLDDAQLWWRPGEGRNSIANLLIHLAGNLGQRFGSVIGGDPDRRDRDAEFAERGPIPKADLVRRLDEVSTRVLAVLDGLAPAQVGEPRRYRGTSQVFETTVLGVVVRSLLHLAAHTQEIIALTRTQLGDNYRPFGKGDW